MITFEGGPAAGEKLHLRSAPFLLRVVRDRKGELDALDQPEDKPKKTEEIFVYVRQGKPFVGHIDYHDGRGRKGEPFINAEYRLCEVQPTDQEARDRNLFTAWCALQPIGLDRAAKLEQHLKTVVGLPQPLRFVRNWCRWQVESLAELTQDQGSELISLAKVEMARARRQIEAEAKRDAERGPKTKVCEACGALMTMAVSRYDGSGRPVYIPLNDDGSSHFTTCTDPKRFSRAQNK